MPERKIETAFKSLNYFQSNILDHVYAMILKENVSHYYSGIIDFMSDLKEPEFNSNLKERFDFGLVPYDYFFNAGLLTRGLANIEDFLIEVNRIMDFYKEAKTYQPITLSVKDFTNDELNIFINYEKIRNKNVLNKYLTLNDKIKAIGIIRDVSVSSKNKRKRVISGLDLILKTNFNAIINKWCVNNIRYCDFIIPQATPTISKEKCLITDINLALKDLETYNDNLCNNLFAIIIPTIFMIRSALESKKYFSSVTPIYKDLKNIINELKEIAKDFYFRNIKQTSSWLNKFIRNRIGIEKEVEKQFKNKIPLNVKINKTSCIALAFSYIKLYLLKEIENGVDLKEKYKLTDSNVTNLLLKGTIG